ncbi:MAG: carboxypeptidase regulatory-like domain-containing protein [Candidatus Acidiferrales bacterium]
MSGIRALVFCAVSFCIFALLASPLRGQTTTSLRGTVTDQSGGVVSGAKVTLTNTGTDATRTTNSGSDGSYLFDSVAVGTYMITVEKAGFAKYVHTGFVLELNQNGRLDVNLKVGQGSEIIEVKSDIVQVDTTGAVLGKVENQRMIQDLPLLDRDTLQLGLLQAGVFAPDPDDGSGNPFSVSGQRSESLTFLLDGANNTDFLGNNIVVSPNPDAVQEFKILTNNYDAEYGRTSGGIVNQITKSGTNSYHGDLFEFLRNDVLNAKDYFLPAGDPKQNFKRNVFGGTVGGPIKKDKTFFFLAYQGTRRREGQNSGVLDVLSDQERTGNFSDIDTQLVNPFTGADIPGNDLAAAGLVNPVIQNYINKYLPHANVGNNGFISFPTAAIDEDQGVMHLDHNLTSRDTLSFVYVIDDLRDAYPFLINKGASTGGNVPIGSGFSDAVRTQIGSFTWIHTFSGGKVNEFRFAANRSASLDAVPADHTSPADLGFGNVSADDAAGTAPPIIFTNSFNLGPSPQGPTTEHAATFQWADNYSWTRGRHELKFGADITRIRQNYNFDFFNNGSFDFTFGNFTGDELADFVGGFWDNYFQFSNAVYGIRTGSLGFYAQDTWKVRPRLTLNYGLRYEYNMPQSDIHNNILGFFPGQQSTRFPDAPSGILYPGDPGTPNRALVYPDRNNFAPRLGFAWDIFGNAKLVMRGGFGIFYDIEDGALNLQFGGQPPFGAVSNFFPSSYAGLSGDLVSDPFTAFGLENPFPFASAGKVGTFLDPKLPFAYTTFPRFRTPYSENFNYGFQWQATRDTMVEAVYVGSLGRKLISSIETNFPDPVLMQQQLDQFGFVNPDCARRQIVTGQDIAQCTGGVSDIDPNGSPTGATQLFTNAGNGLSDSHQFQLTVDKRFSRHFAVRAAYTVAKTIDLTSGFRSRSFQYTDPLDPRLDRALADFDTPQRLVISGIWELPFDYGVHSDGILKKVAEGWQLSGIVSFQKGQPFTLYSNGNASEQNNFLDRPDTIGPVPRVNPRNANNSFSGDCTSGMGHYWFDPTNLVCDPCNDPTCSGGELGVPLFTFGTLGRNAMRGPGINNWDLSLSKRISVRESKYFEFRAEFFNAFNHVQFLNPDNQGFSSTFGQVSFDRGMRNIQFGLKFYY